MQSSGPLAKAIQDVVDVDSRSQGVDKKSQNCQKENDKRKRKKGPAICNPATFCILRCYSHDCLMMQAPRTQLDGMKLSLLLRPCTLIVTRQPQGQKMSKGAQDTMYCDKQLATKRDTLPFACTFWQMSIPVHEGIIRTAAPQWRMTMRLPTRCTKVSREA